MVEENGEPAVIELERIDRFLAEQRPPTPCIVIDLDIVRARYRALEALFPRATIFYAVKANPKVEVITALAELGASFDLASEGEMRRCHELGIPPGRLSFGNTIKREAEVAHAYAEGVNLFAFDSIAELERSRGARRARASFAASWSRARGPNGR